MRKLAVRRVAARVRVVGQSGLRRGQERRSRGPGTGTPDSRGAAAPAASPTGRAGRRAGDARPVGAAQAAAAARGVDEVEQPVTAQQRGRLHEAVLPWSVGAEQLTRRRRQRHAARRERRRDDRGRQPAAVAVALPDEPIAPVLVHCRQRVDLADLAARERPVVAVRPAHPRRGRHGDAAPPRRAASPRSRRARGRRAAAARAPRSRPPPTAAVARAPSRPDASAGGRRECRIGKAGSQSPDVDAAYQPSARARRDGSGWLPGTTGLASAPGAHAPSTRREQGRPTKPR